MAAVDFPKQTRCLVLTRTKSPENPLNDVALQTRDIPQLKPGDLLVRIISASFNHRELWQKKDLYPHIYNGSEGAVMGCDGAGIVLASGTPDDPLLAKRVFLSPIRGWRSDVRGPESRFGVVGGLDFPILGTFSEYVVVERDEVIEVPNHLSFDQAAAWPCAGLTAWRATFVKGGVQPGYNVLITGVGGGVALTCLQLCVAARTNVYVTSSDPRKIENAVSLGAKGGVNYREQDWPQKLAELLKRDAPEGQRPLLDVVIDQAGGDICAKTVKLFRDGGVISIYGMHSVPQVVFTMRETLKNIELKGSTLGSFKELVEATEFISQHKIAPIVSHVLKGLDASLEGFELLEKAAQTGKIVCRIHDVEEARL
ncbi:hypothetical protein FRB99_005122 [Tulasnella sp. 403]|nr:hypothetical protein FRB99_005122 [Tulasnella sp. 403]